jgi:hypothetical protein
MSLCVFVRHFCRELDELHLFIVGSSTPASTLFRRGASHESDPTAQGAAVRRRAV